MGIINITFGDRKKFRSVEINNNPFTFNKEIARLRSVKNCSEYVKTLKLSTIKANFFPLSRSSPSAISADKRPAKMQIFG